MTNPRCTFAYVVLGLGAAVMLLVVSAYVFGAAGSGSGRDLATISGYASMGPGLRGAIISTCSPTPPDGYVSAAGYLVYVDDLLGPPDAVADSNGHWSLQAMPGPHTISIYTPAGPSSRGQSFEVVASAGRQHCVSCERGGG